MTLDILLLAIFLLLVYLGWRSGATGQALRVVFDRAASVKGCVGTMLILNYCWATTPLPAID